MPERQSLLSANEGLKIPEWLDYRSGPYAHQGAATDSWARKWGRGILEMATGAGKTITAMVCAARLQKVASPLLIVIAAPFKPLLAQWAEEVVIFGIEPVFLSGKSPAARAEAIGAAGSRLELGLAKTEAIIVSNATFCSQAFLESIKAIKAEKMLIADECHNLGAPRFIKNPPDFFKYRLGLSATPDRQYDGRGTEILLEYFGDVCFRYPIASAIGGCLCNYDYHIHWVEMAREEMKKWFSLTDKIREEAARLPRGKRSPTLDFLACKRRLLIEEARGKLPAFQKALAACSKDDLRYALVYTTDKAPGQMEKVNRHLEKLGLRWSQLTCEETSRRKMASEILASFKNGSIDILTAKRVLDEGVNIPEIKTAFILASTSVKRQWIQRRGRLLRPCKANGKEKAVIHDFITVPQGAFRRGELDYDSRKMVRSELLRVCEFAHMASNYNDKGGPGEALGLLRDLAPDWED